MTKVSVWLDVRRANRAGKFPLRMVVAHRSGKAYAPLSVELERKQWNERRGEVTNHPRKAFLNAFIGSELARWWQALLGLPERTAAELRHGVCDVVL